MLVQHLITPLCKACSFLLLLSLLLVRSIHISSSSIHHSTVEST
jgi:hypothetical protein